MTHPRDVDDDSPVGGEHLAPVPPTVAALRSTLQSLIAESTALRVDVTRAEQARRRASHLNLGILGLLMLFVALLVAIGWQNNQLAHQVARTNAALADCTTPGGKCYAESGRRTGKAIADVIRAQVFMSECSRLWPGESGPAYDARLESCVNERLANGTLNPAPGRQAVPQPGAEPSAGAPSPRPSTTGGR
jgi:hypothetical protein